jgi:hypothetical protein
MLVMVPLATTWHGCAGQLEYTDLLLFLALQHDNHIQNMSVAETVNFAHTCHSGFGEPDFNLPGELCKAKVRQIMLHNTANASRVNAERWQPFVRSAAIWTTSGAA